MTAPSREAWLTGVGLVTALGEGLAAHRAALGGTRDDWLKLNTQSFAPHQVHPQPVLELDRQMSKRDARQMEPWQRLGVYAAGLALDDAGLKGDKDRLAAMHMIVAAGGGERDFAVDGQILSGLPKAADGGAYLNERLLSDLRPTLFLAQLSNLLAGNISIVHGVVGSSRTFMGEEMAGTDAVRIAVERCHAGQGDMFLVGGAYCSERADCIMHYEFAGMNWNHQWLPVWDRLPDGGMILGAVGAFLVIEARESAEARGAKPIARIAAVSADRTGRKPGQLEASLDRQWSALAPQVDKAKAVYVSGCSGVAEATKAEEAFANRVALPVRAPGSVIGHSLEAAFPANIALAAMMVHDGAAVPPIGGSAFEPATGAQVTQAVVSSVGHWRGEGLALVEAVK